jgi:hypothetical protein
VTIIAVKDNVMVADTMSFVGGLRHPVGRPKITRLPDGSLLGCAGNAEHINAFVAWAKAGMPAGTRPQIPATEDSANLDALMLRPTGRLTRWFDTLNEIDVVPPYATGYETASIFATGAMLAGMSAEQAARLTIQWCVWVGGYVQVEHLHPPEGGRP